MVLIVQNQTQMARLYLGGAVDLAAGGAYQAVPSTLYPLSRDPILVADCANGNVFLSDGTNIYNTPAAMQAYLSQIAGSLGSSVVGYAGAAAPSFQITTGGKDPSGNSQPTRMNQFADQSVNFRNKFKNVTGNGTTLVKTGSGTLHGIMLNNAGSGGTAAIYDGVDNTGTLIGTMQLPSGGLTGGGQAPDFIGPLGLEFTVGLTIVTSGSSANDITAVYQ